MQQFDICRTGSSLLSSYVQMTASFEGKDKVTKVVQYGARFFCWYFRSIAGDLEMEERTRKLFKTTQLSRKAFRMFKMFDELLRLKESLARQDVDDTERGFMAVRSAHKELQTTMGQPQIETELPDSQPVSQSSTQRRHDQGRMAELNAQLVVIKGIADLICAVNMPGIGLPRLFLGHPLNDGIIGISGVISALITLRNQWPAAPTLPK